MRALLFRLVTPIFAGALCSALLASCNSSADIAEEAPTVGTDVGNRPPALQGTLANGEAFTLDPDSDEPIVLVFYRSADCGLCRLQLERMQENLPAYKRVGAALIAITLDPPASSLALAAETQIDFPLISVDTTVFDSWGVMDPELGGPKPATFILDRSGLIHFRHIGRNASDRTTDAGMVAILEGIAGS